MLLTAYFMLFGTGAVAATAAIFLSFVLPSQSNDFKISVPFYGEFSLAKTRSVVTVISGPFKFNYVDVIGLVAALGLSAVCGLMSLNMIIHDISVVLTRKALDREQHVRSFLFSSRRCLDFFRQLFSWLHFAGMTDATEEIFFTLLSAHVFDFP